MNKRSIGILMAVIIVIGGFFWLTKPQEKTLSVASTPSSHIKGSGSANVTLVEYGDFQCSACYQYEPLVKSTFETYKDRIFFQFRNNPLESLHQNARASSRAAEAAHLQGKFWEMHDALYENQDPNGKSGWVVSSDPLNQYFVKFAEQIGLTGTKLDTFKKDYASSKVNDTINADLKAGQKFNITGTPTFVLDGKKITNPRDQAAFNKLIDDAIAAKSKK